MAQISLIATDLDGTLFYDRENITPQDYDAIYAVHNTGRTVAIATGREFEAIAPALDRLDLWGAVDYIIMAGGAQIYDVRGRQTMTVGALTPDMLCRVFLRYQSHPISIILPQNGVFYTNRITKELEAESHLLHIPFVLCNDLTTVFISSSAKLIFHGTESEILSVLPIMDKDTDPEITLCRSHNNYIDCYAAGVNKAAALIQLCNHLSISVEHTAAIGDNHNDLDLLSAAAQSACPSDGVEEAKRQANYVCCPAHEGAFADFCRWLELI